METSDPQTGSSGGWYFVKLRVPFFPGEPDCDPPAIPLRRSRVQEVLESRRLPDIGVLLEELTAFLEEEPDQREAYRRFFAALAYDVGTRFGQGGDHEQACAHFARSVAANPNDAAAFGNLGRALMKLGRFEEALVAYQRAEAIGLPGMQAVRLAAQIGECRRAMQLERRRRRKGSAGRQLHGKRSSGTVSQETAPPGESG